MTTYLGKNSSFGLLCVPFVCVCQVFCVSFFALRCFGEVGMWDVIVFIPDHCLSIYYAFALVCFLELQVFREIFSVFFTMDGSISIYSRGCNVLGFL